MGVYRTSRNLEASFIQYLQDEMTDAWSNVTVEKGMSKVYSEDVSLPIVTIRLNTSIINYAELGSSLIYRNMNVLIQVYAESDGQRLDLKDFLIDKIKGGCPYYEYYIEANANAAGTIKRKVANGRIHITKITDTPIDFDMEKQNLNRKDRFRHMLQINCSINKAE